MSALRTGFIVSLACLVQPAQANNEWLPNYKQLENIEKNITLPKGASKLTEYSRYYTGQAIKGEKFIIGTFVTRGTDNRGIHIVPLNELPILLDGGCSVISFKYNVNDKKIVSIFCHGEA